MRSGQQISGISIKEKLTDTLAAGIVLWVIGYSVAMVLFAFVPATMIGWIVLPIMIPVTACVSFWRLKDGSKSIPYILLVSATWTAVAVTFDYVFLVYPFNVQNYYDFDVMIYYALTFLIPAIIGTIAHFRLRRRTA
jgi:hypothetical protein